MTDRELNVPPAHLMIHTVWRHIRRKTLYTVVSVSTFQTAVNELDDVLVVTYKCQERGVLYTRPYNEFVDGRFERVM